MSHHSRISDKSFWILLREMLTSKLLSIKFIALAILITSIDSRVSHLDSLMRTCFSLSGSKAIINKKWISYNLRAASKAKTSVK